MSQAIYVQNPKGRIVDVTQSWFRENRNLFSNGPWRVVASRPKAGPAADMPTKKPRKRPVILHVMPWQMSMGGAQRFFCDLARHFKSFCDIHVVYPKHGSDDHWSRALSDVRCHSVSNTGEAAAVVKNLNPDLVHHHHPSGKWLWEVINGKYPVLGTQHGWEANKDPMPCVAPICGEHENVIRHGVDLAQFKPSRRRKRNGIFTVGIVGRRSPEKLPPTFISALAAWDVKDIKVRLIGRGLTCPQTETAEARLRRIPFVELAADVAPDEMPAVYYGLDALIVPSRLDSTSYAALEAMACRVPVIARRVQGLPETVGDAGLLCDTDDELLKAVEYLKDNPKKREKYRRRGLDRVRKYFDARRMLADYEKLYDARSAGIVRPAAPGLDLSVVIPVYNTPANWLRESVVSVMDQKEVRFEIVCVDDGSTNKETLDELKHLDLQEGVRVIRVAHGGVGPACNAGIRAAKADLIARHDADDVMMPGRLAAQARYMAAHSDIDLIAGQMEIMDASGSILKRTNLRFDESRFIGDQPWAVAHPTVCFRRYPVLAAGGYIPGPAQDFDLWCRLQAGGLKMRVLPEFFTRYRTHPGQQTARKDHGTHAARLRRKHRAPRKNRARRRTK